MSAAKSPTKPFAINTPQTFGFYEMTICSFRVLATSSTDGLIELIPSMALEKILHDSEFRSINKYLAHYHPDPAGLPRPSPPSPSTPPGAIDLDVTGWALIACKMTFLRIHTLVDVPHRPPAGTVGMYQTALLEGSYLYVRWTPYRDVS